MDLGSLGIKARAILKALNGGDEGKDKDKEPKDGTAPVPEAPKDADRLDPRVEDASPTAADLAGAKDSAGDAAGDANKGDADGAASGSDAGADGAGDGAGTGDNAGSGDGAGAGGDAGAGAGDGAGDGDPDDYKDMDVREIKKAFPQIGHLFPEEAVESVDKGGTSAEEMLKTVIHFLGSQGLILDRLQKQIDELKSGASAEREVKKSLDETQSKLADLQKKYDELHKTLPPASEPRAISKALAGEREAPSGALSHADVMKLAQSGEMNSVEIALLCQGTSRT